MWLPDVLKTPHLGSPFSTPFGGSNCLVTPMQDVTIMANNLQTDVGTLNNTVSTDGVAESGSSSGGKHNNDDDTSTSLEIQISD